MFADRENLRQEGLLLPPFIVLPISILLVIIIIHSSVILNCLWMLQIPRVRVSPFISNIVSITSFLFLCLLPLYPSLIFSMCLALTRGQNNSFSRNMWHKTWLTLLVVLGPKNILQLPWDISFTEYVHSIIKYIFKATCRTFLYDNK